MYSFWHYRQNFRKQNMSAKQAIHKSSLMVKMHIMHISAELTAYWLACFICICRNVEFVCSGTYICNVASIFGQGHMQLCEMYVYLCMWWHCWLYVVDMWYIYWHGCLTCGHELLPLISIIFTQGMQWCH